MRYIILATLIVTIISGCSTYHPATAFDSPMPTEKPTLTQSLFSSDNAVLSDEAIKKILSSSIEIPKGSNIAIMKMPSQKRGALRYYGSYYWRSEDFLKTQQKYIDTVSAQLKANKDVSTVTVLPSLLTPKRATIPLLREAAVRLQSDLVLVFQIDSDTYHQSKLFSRDKIKAYCTCEAVLLDVRTGVIPFTAIVTKESIEQKTSSDFDISETMRRAETKAVLLSLNSLGDQLGQFMKTK